MCFYSVLSLAMKPRVLVYAGIIDETDDKTNKSHALKKFTMPLVNASYKSHKVKSTKLKQMHAE